MDDSTTRKLLSVFPNAKRAAKGVLIPMGNGQFFHAFDIRTSKDTEGLTDDETFFLPFCSKKEIIRLRELKSADDYLLRLRALAIVDAPRVKRVMDHRKNIYTRSRKPWSLSHYYHSRDHYHKSYVALLHKHNRQAVAKVPGGLVFTNEVNAMCIRSLAGDVIIASETLEHFYYFMTIALYPTAFGVNAAESLDALLIAVRIVQGTEALDFDLDPRVQFSRDIERRLNSIVKAQMQFTFGHEYAHLLRGHLAESESLQLLSGPDSACDVKIYEHELEYEADHYALKLIAHNHAAYPGIAEGAFYALLNLYALEQAQERLGLRKSKISSTHPTARDRVIRLQKNLGPQDPFFEEDMTEYFEHCERISEALTARLGTGVLDNPISFYGSIYLQRQRGKMKRDRIDF